MTRCVPAPKRVLARALDGVVATMCLACPAALHAQTGHVTTTFESYAARNQTAVRLHDVRLHTSSFGAAVPLTRWASASIEAAYASASMRLTTGEQADVAGLLDTRAAVEARLGGFALVGSALLPTGDVAQTVEEATVAGLLSADLLPFSATHWGSGGAFAADLGYGAESGRIRIGLSAGYVALAESDPFAVGTVTYRPGSQMRARGMFEVAVREADVLTVIFGAQSFGTDAYAEQNLFTPGVRIEGLVSYAMPLGPRESLRAYGRLYRMGAGILAWELAPPPELGGVLPGTAAQPSRKVFAAGFEMRVARPRLAVVPGGEIRVLRSADGFGQGWVGSLTTRAEYRVRGARQGRRLLVGPSLGVRLGRLGKGAGAQADIFGWEGGLTLRVEAGP